ncbi:MAG TPA: glycosyltransferase family 87 protein [Candidatus Limnocylindria bacterium]|nr:glycosyltransferase family 87 protein [Candidatus Limnocylindria bacterium]
MSRTQQLPSSVPGWIFFVAATLLFALMCYALSTYALSREVGADVAAYWEAAERIRAGEPLYVAGAANASDLYRYAPWFAFAWVPLTFLPREAVTAAWVGLMIVAAIVSTAPLVRHGLAGTAAFSLFAPIQLEAAVFGNVQPLLVLMLMWSVERRSGPLWIALGASLKAVPLLLAVVYAGRGEWRRAGLAVLFTAVLVAPALLYDLSAYSTDPGPGQISLTAVAGQLYLAVAIALVGLTFAAARARSRFAWLAGAGAMMAALPRLLPYEIGLLLVGLAEPRRAEDPVERTAEPRPAH